MAEDILANSPSKLNLSRRQTAVLQGILYTASQMAELLKDSAEQITDANRAAF